jgi:BirA family biotin operon repressor/biotin-[acetyl-CoA-carboxylase] ligase
LNNFISKTKFIGKEVVFLPSCHSTNEYAKNLVKNKEATNGQIVITNDQTDGKGQRGAKWESAPGKNLTFSLIYYPTQLELPQAFKLTQAISCAVVQALKEIEIQATIKWPNDIYINDSKVAGILIENQIQGILIKSTVIGIGLNVNQLEFSYPTATSIAQFKKTDYPLEQILQLLVKNIENEFEVMDKLSHNELNTNYLNHLYKYKEKHMYSDTNSVFEGIIEGVNEDGTLNVYKIKEAQTMRYSLKEIRFL